MNMLRKGVEKKSRQNLFYKTNNQKLKKKKFLFVFVRYITIHSITCGLKLFLTVCGMRSRNNIELNEKKLG